MNEAMSAGQALIYAINRGGGLILERYPLGITATYFVKCKIYIIRCTIILFATKKGKTANYNRKTHESQMKKFGGRDLRTEGM